MGQVLHGSARTTEAVRRAIQHSQESLRSLARRHGVNPKTIAKWRKRTLVADRRPDRHRRPPFFPFNRKQLSLPFGGIPCDRSTMQRAAGQLGDRSLQRVEAIANGDLLAAEDSVAHMRPVFFRG